MDHKVGKVYIKPDLSSPIFLQVLNNTLFIFLVFLSVALQGCKFKKNDLNEKALISERKSINDRYPKIPTEEILQQNTGAHLYTELQEHYRSSLESFKSIAENDCVKLVVVILTPELGKSQTLANTYGVPFILETCNSLNIDCIDLTPSIVSNDLNDITLLPEDIHWSKNGSAYIANLLTNIVFKYGNLRNTKTYPDSMRAKGIGDLPLNDNEVLGGEMNLPYRLKTNAQGLRMNHNLTFPKKKQTILFLGNSNIYSPYIDNEFIATELLQTRFPDKEILNAGMEKYTIEDELSLYVEKAKYAEPDVVVLCTDGSDLINYFFTQRNHFSRLKKVYNPSATEKAFYSELFGTSIGPGNQ